MKLFGPLSRIVALVGLLVATPLAMSAPAYAAAADVALLKSYVGSWKGRGTLVGADSEAVVCRLTLSEGNNDKVNYKGSCSLAGTALSVNGTLAYIDAKKRYEAAMTTNASFSPAPAVGQRSGDGVLFKLRERGKDDEGNDITISAEIGLQKSKITVTFNVVFNSTGDSIRASVPFSK